MGSDDPLIAAQREILSVLRMGWSYGGIYADEPVRAEVFVQDLKVLGAWILGRAQRDELCIRASDALARAYAAESDARELHTWAPAGQRVSSARVSRDAVTVAVAVPVLTAADTMAAGERLRWLTTSIRRRGLSVRTPRRWPIYTSPALNAIARHIGVLHQ
ncbi:hypothetical protein [Mycolicibacterium sp. 018/SC-01/001]|uniref:hypothetical protein n=1 Tax=Mycolicibacterium sp. 018/SC-01/001 TaxID=2592069 RepID=UPI002107BBE7|nr:hypothetical protein [Mycolicibacterium sp. 018/SC-01/001]